MLSHHPSRGLPDILESRSGSEMKIDFHTHSIRPDAMAALAPVVEECGYDSLWSTETSHDPFVALALAAQCTEKIRVGTGLAVAFARNPMSTAMLANDLHLVSKGRFVLGLGSQLQSHITKRFSMPWSAPAARMREFVLAMRAIWHTFETDERLRFRGTHYRHTQMSPYFNPGPNPYGNPPIMLAGVGERMHEVAGEVADGYLAHLLCSRHMLEAMAIPALRKGRERAGRTMDGFLIHASPFVVTGRTEAEFAASARAVRERIAFYASIPTYSGLLELHGMQSVRDDLYRLAAAGRLAELPSVIDDQVLDTFAVVGEPDRIAALAHARFGGLVDSIGFQQDDNDPRHWLGAYAGLRKLDRAARPAQT